MVTKKEKFFFFIRFFTKGLFDTTFKFKYRKCLFFYLFLYLLFRCISKCSIEKILLVEEKKLHLHPM